MRVCFFVIRHGLNKIIKAFTWAERDWHQIDFFLLQPPITRSPCTVSIQDWSCIEIISLILDSGSFITDLCKIHMFKSGRDLSSQIKEQHLLINLYYKIKDVDI